MDVTGPRVTVLMPVYNGERFLCQAVESILNQSFDDFHFLIINDGSTDRTEEILTSYTDPRIELMENPANLGLTKSLNRGLSRARGEYVARMDGDDVSMPERLASQVEFLDENPKVVITGSYYIKIDTRGRKVSEIMIPQRSDHVVAQLFFENPFSHGSLMVRTDAVVGMGGYDESVPYGQDYNLLVRAARIGELGVVPRFLYQLRMVPQGISTLKHREQLDGIVRYSSDFLRLCLDNPSEDEVNAFARFQRARLTRDWSLVRSGDTARIRPVFSLISRTSFGRRYWRKHLFSWAVYLLRHSRTSSLELFSVLLKEFSGICEPKQLLRYAYYYAKACLPDSGVTGKG